MLQSAATEVATKPTEVIIAVSSLVTALGIGFLWYQARLLRQQIVADHERSRRELTISLCQRWNQAVSPVSGAAERLVNQLSEAQCRELAVNRPFAVSEGLRPLLETCLAEVLVHEQLAASSAGAIALTQKQVTRLRFLVLDYLNETESVLLAWMMGVADKETIEQQFQFICDPKLGYDAVERFRNAMGSSELFPSITLFVQQIRDRRSKVQAPARDPLVPIG